MAPNTLTFRDVGVKAPSGAGLIGRPRRLPTTYGCGPVAAGGCCAISEPANVVVTSAVATVMNSGSRFIGIVSHDLDEAGAIDRMRRGGLWQPGAPPVRVSPRSPCIERQTGAPAGAPGRSPLRRWRS